MYRDMVDLRQRLIDTHCKAINVDGDIDEWCKRLQALVDEKEQFDHLLWHLGSTADLLCG